MTEDVRDLSEARRNRRPLGRQCTATSKRSGQRCRRWAVIGSSVCQVHGGAAPQTKRAAARRLATERAESELARLGARAEPVDDPAEELARVAGDALALLDVLRTQVAKLSSVSEGPAELGAYMAALQRAESTLASCLRAGVAERRVVIAEATGHALVTVIEAVMRWIVDQLAAGASTESIEAGWRPIIAAEIRAIDDRVVGQRPEAIRDRGYRNP